MSTEIRVPTLGESVTEATVGQWFKKAGDAVTADEPVVIASADPSTQRPPSRFREGKHYKRLTPTQPTSSPPDKIEVAEVFWYGCNHCYNLDPFVIRWANTRRDSNVAFIRIHAMWNETLRVHSRAFYTMQVLGKSDEMHTPMFEEIHVRGNFLNTPELQSEFFSRFGVDKNQFDSTYLSFAVETRMQRADELNRRYRVRSVPVIIVHLYFILR